MSKNTIAAYDAWKEVNRQVIKGQKAEYFTLEGKGMFLENQTTPVATETEDVRKKALELYTGEVMKAFKKANSKLMKDLL